MSSYEPSDTRTDSAALTGLGRNIAQHRLQRNLTQAELAKEAGVSKRTLIRLEQGESIQVTNLIRVLRVLGLLRNLDELVPPPPPSPLEQFKGQRRRKRASSSGTDPAGAKPWAWGDEDSESGDQDHGADDSADHDQRDDEERGA